MRDAAVAKVRVLRIKAYPSPKVRLTRGLGGLGNTIIGLVTLLASWLREAAGALAQAIALWDGENSLDIVRRCRSDCAPKLTMIMA
jgi:hypothetical protein